MPPRLIVALLLLLIGVKIVEVLPSDVDSNFLPMWVNGDEHLNSMLEEDDFLKDIFPGEVMLNDGYVSGDVHPENDSEEIGIQTVMDMMFKNGIDYTRLEPDDSPAKERERRKNSSQEKIHKEPSQTARRDLLRGIEKLLSRNSNTSFRVENGVLIVNESSSLDYHESPVLICGFPMHNVSDFEQLFSGMQQRDEAQIIQLFGSYLDGNITKRQLKHRLAKHVDKIPCYQTTTEARPVTSSSLFEFQLTQLRQLVDDGYAEKSLLQDFEDRKITIEEIHSQLMKDKKFVLSRFPVKIEEMLEDDRIPEEIVDKMFSGKLTLQEVRSMLYQDDSISKALLPERVREILEDRYPSQELKDMLLEGHNHSVILVKKKKNETLLQDLMSESMFYFYTLFKVPRNVMLNMALSGTTIVALCFVMTSLGCTMTVSEIMKHVRRPKGVLIALVSQYGIMPAAAFGLTQAFDLDVYPAIAVLICGCCPGGNLSNLLAFAINGDMNLSILMTTCSSVFGLAMMPFLLFCYSRFIIPVDGSEIVPFDKIILNIALTIVPVSIGIAIKHYRPTWTKVIMRCGAVMLLVCSITFSVIAGFLLGDKFFSYFPLEVVICASILPMTGYILGFLFARLVRENQKCSRTISVETGCQNVQLCGTVLKLAFDPILIGAVMLLPIIYMAFQAGEAILLISIYRLYERCTKKEGVTEEIKFDDEEKKLEKSDSETKIAEQNDKDVNDSNNGGEKRPERDGGSKLKESVSQESSEDWPLVPKADENYLDAFEKSKENYV